MLVDYWKAFANKENKYPKKLPDMIDVMRQIPERKWKPPKVTTKPIPKNEEKKEETASNFAQKG